MNKPKTITRTTNLDSAAEQIGVTREELNDRLKKAGINLAARKIKTLTTNEIEKLKNIK